MRRRSIFSDSRARIAPTLGATSLAAVALVAVGPLASRALAASYVWNNPAGGSWNDPANWTAVGVPGAADSATFNSGTTTPITVGVTSGETVASILFDNANAAAYTIGTGASPALTLSDTTRTIVVNSAVTRNQLFNAQVLLGTTATANTFTMTNNGSGTLAFAGGFSTAQTTNAKTLAVGGTGNTFISGAITNGSATLGLTKNFTGTGVLTLSGANTYTGNTTVENGTLRLDFANSGPVTSNIINHGLVTGGSALTLGRSNQNVATGGTIEIVGGASGTFSQRFNNTALVSVNNAVRVIEAVGTTVNLELGTLSRGSNFALVDFTLPTNGTVKTTTTTHTNGILTSAGAYATVDGTDWVTNSAGTLGRLTSYTDAASAAATSNVSVTGNETLSAATINTLRIDSSTQRTLDLTGTHVVTAGGVLVTAGSTNGATIGTTIDDGTLRSGTSVLNVINRSPGTLTINSAIGNGTGGNDVLYAGNVLLKGTNTYAGVSRIYPGTTRIVNASNLGGAGNVVVYSGGTLEFDGASGDIALAAGKTFTINGSGLPGAGGAVRNVAGNNSIGALTVGNAGSVNTIYSAAGKLTIGGTVSATNANVTVDGPGDVQFDGNVSLGTASSGLLFKNGAGTLYINNATNSYNALTINAGVYDTPLATMGTAILNLNGGVFQVRDGGTFARTLSAFPGASGLRMNSGSTGFAARGSADAAVSLSSGATLTWASTSGFLGASHELVLGSAIADRAIDFTNAINLNNAVRTVQVIDNPNVTTDHAELSGVLSHNTGGLTKTGAGTLLLTAANTYKGATTVNAGTLLVGDGTSGSLDTTAVSVNNAGTLGGSGSIAGTVTVNSGGRLAPGNSVGTLTINNTLTLNAGSISDFEIASVSSFDKIVGLTGATYDGTLNVTGTIAAQEAVYQLFALASGSTLTNFDFVNLPAAPATFAWRDFDPGAGVSYFDPSTGSIELVLVPEPSVMALTGIGIGALLTRRRAKRSA